MIEREDSEEQEDDIAPPPPPIPFSRAGMFTHAERLRRAHAFHAIDKYMEGTEARRSLLCGRVFNLRCGAQ